MKTLFIRIFLILLLLAAVSAAGVMVSYRYIEQWGETPFGNVNASELTLQKGQSLKAFAASAFASSDLSEESASPPPHRYLLTNAQIFAYWIKLFSDYRQYQAGRYQVLPGETPKTLAQKIRKGEVYEPVVLELTIPEGFTLEQIFQRAEKSKIGTFQELLLATQNPALRTEYPLLPKPSDTDHAKRKYLLEGFLFPATYQFTSYPTADEFVKTLVRTFFERLPENYQQRLNDTELSLQDGVTIASLIERETQQPIERSIVSEVIHNRLSKGIALAIDASVIHGIKDYDGNIRKKHLRDTSNLYNTRVHRGLPPGPICSPSAEAMKAVLTPTHHGYFYYVVSAEDFSRHSFARTLKEHNNNVAAFLRARKQKQ